MTMRRPVRDEQHGTITGYQYGCRCGRCREAQRVAALEQRARRANGTARQRGRRTGDTPPANVNAAGPHADSHGIPGPGPWIAEAACLGVDTNTFFPHQPRTGERRALTYRQAVVAARAICAGCAVLADCAAYIAAHPQDGIWAGTTEDERRARRQP